MPDESTSETDNFEGEEFDGEADPELGPEEDTDEMFGMGALIASLHAIDESEDDDQVIYMAAMAASDNKGGPSDETVAADLLKTVKANYEARGSGIQSKPQGRTPKQLRADSQKEWASNSNLRNKEKELK